MSLTPGVNLASLAGAKYAIDSGATKTANTSDSDSNSGDSSSGSDSDEDQGRAHKKQKLSADNKGKGRVVPHVSSSRLLEPPIWCNENGLTWEQQRKANRQQNTVILAAVNKCFRIEHAELVKLTKSRPKECVRKAQPDAPVGPTHKSQCLTNPHNGGATKDSPSSVSHLLTPLLPAAALPAPPVGTLPVAPALSPAPSPASSPAPLPSTTPLPVTTTVVAPMLPPPISRGWKGDNTAVVDLADLATYAVGWQLWRDLLQPEWRTKDKGRRWHMVHDFGVRSRRQRHVGPVVQVGVNGTLTIVASLYFCGLGVQAADTNAQGVWEKAVVDVGWILEGLALFYEKFNRKF
ncbi:hypothetical protein B0H16DRAFT_1458450 [Mycena metata]|uniref:Uncharacterized protein n=1 Tax=Mycena metata TaxID=1033252 RepID=A0AAD7NE40_9AGAR|nr:hypothetical protein B0H16DRAFT_1458450 [Mycena metata]